MHPDRIGPWIINRKVGAGGMGNVYHGTHESSGEVAAVKVLPASMAREEGFVHRFSREIDALRKVTSPNIVQIFDDGQTDDGSLYFSMEYVDGETLTKLISRSRRLPWAEVIEISIQIANALKAAHNTGIIHRDLKPSNLMITGEGEVKLADFGVAHVFASTRLTRTGGIVGTAEYMSPEQARGHRATKLSDLYSLGAVMYVMLTGKPPFSGNAIADIMHKHQFGQFDKPSHYAPDLPRQLEDFVCKLLEKRPERRIPDALVVGRQLTNIRNLIQYEQEQKEQEQKEKEQTHVADRTVGAAAGQTAGVLVDRPDMSRGPATIVRDAVRQEIADSQKKSPVAAFFDNTYVLIAMLALVIAAGFYLSRQNKTTPEEIRAEAEALMKKPAGHGWLRARDDLLRPLVESSEEAAYDQEVRDWIHKADQYEFARGLRKRSFSDGSTQSEVQRLISQAFQTWNDGDVGAARARLLDVERLLTDRDAYLRSFIRQTLDEWREDPRIAGRKEMLREILREARSSQQDEQEIDRTAERLRSLINIYGEDQTVAIEVQKCRELLTQLDQQSAESSNGKN